MLTPTADELDTLWKAGLQPRKGVPGLYLCRDEDGDDLPIVPPNPIKLEGRAQELACAMRDELATRLKKKGTEGLPTSDPFRMGEERADLMGAWLQGANLKHVQLQRANLRGSQLQGANLRGSQLQGTILREAKLQGADLGGARLDETYCLKAQLQKAKLVRANLSKANLTKANLAGADFTSADLTKANLNEALESMRNYRPPHPPAALASNSWRSKSVIKSTAEAVYKRVAQADDDDDDDDDDGDSSASEDSEDGEAALAPWLKAAEEVAARAAGALVGVAQPVLLVVSATVAELEQLCDALAERMPEALVRSIVSLLEKQPALPAAQLQKAVATRLKLLLKTCMLDLIFDQALPGAIRALEKQIEQVQLWVKGDQTLSQQAMVRELQDELCTLTAKLCVNQQQLFEKFSEGCSPPSRAPTAVVTAPVAMGKVVAKHQMQLGAFEALVYSPSNGDEQRHLLGLSPPALSRTASLVPPLLRSLQLRSLQQADGSDEEEHGYHLLSRRRRSVTDVTDETDETIQAMLGQLRDLAGDILCAITHMLADDLNAGLEHLKKQAQVKLDVFAESAASPIAIALKDAKSLKTVQLAKQLPEVRGYIEALKKELCEDALRKRVTKGLLGAASKPLQGIGHGAEQTLALSVKFEECLTAKLEKVDEAAKKLLRRHLPQGTLRARAFETVLKAATKYNMRVGDFDGSYDMLRLAWRRSRVELTTDENQLVYLSEKLKKLEDKESTVNNWRDTAEGWISVLELRGQLRVQCGQSVLECIAADKKVLEALGAAKVLMHIDGDTPPAALVTIIAQGPGAHIRKHGYRYSRRLERELMLIRRVKELQMRAVAGVGTLLVATSIAVGNYLARVMYDGATNGFGSQSWRTWVLPFAVLIGLLVLCCFGFATYFCYTKKECWRRPLRACIAPV